MTFNYHVFSHTNIGVLNVTRISLRLKPKAMSIPLILLYLFLACRLAHGATAHNDFIVWLEDSTGSLVESLSDMCALSGNVFGCDPFRVNDIHGCFVKSPLVSEDDVRNELAHLGLRHGQLRVLKDTQRSVESHVFLHRRDEEDKRNKSATVAPPPKWGLDRINQAKLPLDSDTALPPIRGNVSVYVIDTGITCDHPDFEGRAVWGANFADDVDSDCGGHGTHVAGTIGSRSYGVAPGVQLVAVKVLGCNGQGSWKGVIKGIEWILADVANRTAINADSDPIGSGENVTVRAIANASLGGKKNELVNRCYDQLVKRGIALVVSAGNRRGMNACDFTPAGVTNAITVGGSNWLDERSKFSNVGPCVDVFAPGSFITSLYPPTLTAILSGTSMASPHVAGVLALLISHQRFTMSALSLHLKALATRGALSNLPNNTCNLLLRAPK
jgi:hypothetical protein